MLFRSQDLIQEQMAGETSEYQNGGSINNLKHLAANKTVAWLDYMTNFNKTFADFAAGEQESYMVLNRIYNVDDSGNITNATTYITERLYVHLRDEHGYQQRLLGADWKENYCKTRDERGTDTFNVNNMGKPRIITKSYTQFGGVS